MDTKLYTPTDFLSTKWRRGVSAFHLGKVQRKFSREKGCKGSYSDDSFLVRVSAKFKEPGIQIICLASWESKLY